MIAIIGGGISGLAAAHELARRGVPFELFEAAARAGGLIHTERQDGFIIDAGPDSMLASKPAARTLCTEVGLESHLIQMTEPRTAYVLDRNRLHPLASPSLLGIPLTRAGALRFELLPPRARVRLLLEPYARRGRGDDETIASFFRRRLGAATVERIAQPLLGGIHAGDVERLSLNSLFPALKDAEARGGLFREFRDRQPPGGGLFNSLAGGMSTLPAAILRSLPQRSIRFGAEVRMMTATSDGWRLEAATGTHHAAGVLLAVPTYTAAKLLASIDPEAAGLCAEVPHASTATVALAWRRDEIAHPLRGSGFVVARDQGRITASTWVSSKWPDRSPQGYTLVRAFIGGVRDPHAVDLPEAELIRIATSDLGRILGIRTEPRFARVFRWRDASPQLNVGHGGTVREIERRLAGHRGLFATGRGLRTVGIPDCVADARLVAASAAEYLTRSHRESTSENYQHG